MSKTGVNGRRKGASKHVRQYEWMLASPAYHSLSLCARCLLTELGRRYNGTNNGNIAMSIRTAAELLGTGKNRAANAFADLQERGFIKLSVKGGFTFKDRHATTWILTEHRLNDQPPMKDFMKWEPS